MLIPKETAQDLAYGRVDDECDGYTVVENTIIGHSRWSVGYRLVVEKDGEYGEAAYSRGATEQQDEYPFEYDDDPVEFADVEPVFVEVIQFEPIKK